MSNEQILEEARVTKRKITSGTIAAILWLILAAFFVMIGFFFMTNISEYDSRRNIMYIWFALALIFCLTQLNSFRWFGFYLLVSKPIPFDINFEEILSIPSNKNISIYTKNGEYYIPVEQYKADSIRNIIEKSNGKK